MSQETIRKNSLANEFENQSGSTATNRSKRKDLRKKKALPMAPIVSVVAVGSLAIGALSGAFLFNSSSTDLKPVKWENGNVGFVAAPQLGEGWIDASATLSDADDAQGSVRNPLDVFNESCSVIRTTAYLPKSSNGRGDDFLTKNALFSLLDSRNEKTDISKAKIQADGKTIDAYQNIAESMAVAVRAFDKVQAVPEDIKTVKPSTGATSTKEGMPVVTITYSCANKDEFSEDTWKQVLSSSEITLLLK